MSIEELSSILNLSARETEILRETEQIKKTDRSNSLPTTPYGGKEK